MAYEFDSHTDYKETLIKRVSCSWLTFFLYICLEAGAFGDTNELEYAYESNEMKGSNPCLRGTFTLFRLPQEEALRALCRHYNRRKNVVQHNHILTHAAVWAPRRRPSYAKHLIYTLNVGTYVRASASEGHRTGSVHQRVKASSTSGCLLAVHLAMRIKDAGQPLRG